MKLKKALKALCATPVRTGLAVSTFVLTTAAALALEEGVRKNNYAALPTYLLGTLNHLSKEAQTGIYATASFALSALSGGAAGMFKAHLIKKARAKETDVLLLHTDPSMNSEQIDALFK